MITIVCDTNKGEHEIHESLQERIGDLEASKPDMRGKVSAQKGRLDVGDFHVILGAAPGGGKKTLIVERKEWADLCASITDGRYKEQKSRMMYTVENQAPGDTAAVVYAVQTPVVPSHDDVHGRLSMRFVFQAIAMTQMRDSIPVLWCQSKEDVASTLMYLAQKLMTNAFDPSNVASSQARLNYGSVCASVRKRKNTQANQWEIMLLAIEGMGPKKAQSISERWASAGELIGAGRQALADHKVGKARVGDALSSKVFAALTGASGATEVAPTKKQKTARTAKTTEA